MLEPVSPRGLLVGMATGLSKDLWSLYNDKKYRQMATERANNAEKERYEAAIQAANDDGAAMRLKKQWEAQKSLRKKLKLGMAIPFPSVPLLHPDLDIKADGEVVSSGWAVDMRLGPRPYPGASFDIYEAIDSADGRVALGQKDYFSVNTYTDDQPPHADITLPAALLAENSEEDATYLTLDLIMLARQAIQARITEK
jgi:hypothetical protein